MGLCLRSAFGQVLNGRIALASQFLGLKPLVYSIQTGIVDVMEEWRKPRPSAPPKWAKIEKALFPKGIFHVPGDAATLQAELSGNLTRIEECKKLVSTRQVIPGSEEYDKIKKEQTLLEVRNDFLTDPAKMAARPK